MTLSVCLLPDRAGDRAVRALWTRLEEAGIPTLLSHTHGRHVPHLTLASLLDGDTQACQAAAAGLERAQPTTVRLGALGMFPKSRCWLAPSVVEGLVERQQRLVDAVVATGARLHRSYRPGLWVPHLTLAPRLRLSDLPVVARQVFEVLPVTVTFTRAAVIDTSTGELTELPHVV